MQRGRIHRPGPSSGTVPVRCRTAPPALLPLLGAALLWGCRAPAPIDPLPPAPAPSVAKGAHRAAGVVAAVGAATPPLDPSFGLRTAPIGADPLATRLGRAFERALPLVAAASGSDLSDVALALVDDASLGIEVAAETRRLVQGRLGDGAFAERLLDVLVDGQIGTYAALYSGRRRTVLVSRDVLDGYVASLPPGERRLDDALLVLMLHELAHAADDTRHAIHLNRTLDFRASFAQSAVFEGHAQWLTRDICRRHGCLDGLASLDTFMFGERAGTAATARSAARDLLEYSYVEGERFVAAVAERPGGERLIERMLSAPPRDPLQILDPASFPDEAREARNRALLYAARTVEHPWLNPAADGRTPGAAGLRIAVETSPLKGVDLRTDPERRRAAIDGFTRLITAMVAVQFHDPAAETLSPIEVTLMHTDTARTAMLFADTLYAHAFTDGARARADGPVTIDAGPGGDVSGDVGDGATGSGAEGGTGEARRRVPRRLLRAVTTTPEGEWYTSIASGGPFVVQANGRDAAPALIDDYVLGVLAALLGGPA